MLLELIKPEIPEKLANEMDLKVAYAGTVADDDPTTALAVMIHKVNGRSEGNVIRLYKFIDENGKFVLKSELAAFSLPDAKSATSFSTRLLHMSSEELFVSLEEEGGKMAEMAPDMLH